MTTTCQQVLNGAIGWSTANTLKTLTNDVPLLLGRINFDQQDLFTRMAQENRWLWSFRQVKGSGPGSSGRVLDLDTGTTLPVERLLRVELPNGTEVSGVDLNDQAAELAPRFYPSGRTLVEIGSEWAPLVPGSVNLTIWAAYRPVALDLAGSLTQLVSVPDQFTDYLELGLAIWLVERDFGRDAVEGEIKRLGQLQASSYQRLTLHVDHFAGSLARRFALPVPLRGSQA